MRLFTLARRATLGVLVVAVFAVLPAAAGASTMGTPAIGIIERDVLDIRKNFSMMDTGQVATEEGVVTRINYYAQATGTIAFLLVDPSGVVQWVSPLIAVDSTGVMSYTPVPTPAVAAGWRLGYYTAGEGVIPFDHGGPTTDQTAPIGLPIVGQPFVAANRNLKRTYSLGAEVSPPLPATKAQCKDPGWQSYGVFKNHGDCVSFVATGGKNPPAGP